MIVILDPGHNGEVPGKRSPDGRLREYRWARELTEILEEKLDELEIRHTRTTGPEEDEGPEVGLTNRCKRANAFSKKYPKEKSIFISIHVNAAGNEGKWMSARGWSVFVSPTCSGNSKRLASLLATEAGLEHIKVRKPDPEHSYWVANFTVLTKTSMPAVLVENLFQDNLEDVKYLLSDQGKDTLSEIIIKGICDYFGINK